MSFFMNETEDEVIFKVQVQPRASQDEVEGPHGDVLKIRIKAAPVRGAANRQLLRFLAKKLKISQSQITIRSGATSRTKSIVARGISVGEIRERLS